MQLSALRVTALQRIVTGGMAVLSTVVIAHYMAPAEQGFYYTFASFFATPSPVHGFRSLIRHTVWELVVNPLLKVYFLVVVGSTLGGIYTPNLLTVTTKSSGN